MGKEQQIVFNAVQQGRDGIPAGQNRTATNILHYASGLVEEPVWDDFIESKKGPAKLVAGVLGISGHRAKKEAGAFKRYRQSPPPKWTE